MEKVAVDRSTRLFDREVLKTLDGYLKHQIDELNAGSPRNAEKFKVGAEELLLRAEVLQDLESAVKKGKKLEIPQWYRDLYDPKPKAEPKRTNTKLVAVAPTTGQIQTMVAREVAKMKGEVLAAIQGLKVAK